MPDNSTLQQNPLIQALQVVFGRSEFQMAQMRGQQPPGDKPVNLDTIENNLSRIFIGYADIQMDRQTKYRDYERMDVQSTEFQTALDIYAEECSQKDQKTGLSVWVESDDPEIASELNGMFQRIKLDEKAYGIYRNIAKFGDTYTFNILGAYGVHGIQFIHPSRVERIQQDGLQGFKCPELTRALPPSNKDGIYSPWDFCTDSITEILTETRGWVLFKDLLPEDKVATRNLVTKEFEWQQPSNYVNSPYSGDMIRIKSNSVDLLVTPNHRMLVTTGTNRIKEEFFTAESLANSSKRKYYFKIPMTSTWVGEEVKEKIFNVQIGKSVTRPAIPVTMTGDQYVAFMAMYLSEGHSSFRGTISIGQQTTSKGYEPYKQLLEDILGVSVRHDGNAFLFSRSVLAELLYKLGLSEDKYIPQDIMNATPRQLQIFWDYYMLGDGSVYKRAKKTARTIGNCNGTYTSIHTTSNKLAGQLQEIAQKLGLSASVWTRPKYTKIRKKDGRKYECKQSYVVAIRHNKLMGFSATKEQYNGTVHCVTVPNSVIYVRRNGKPAWTGNCHFRLIAYDQESLYGRSMGEPIRKVWKQYSMVEQMVVLYRLTKAVQRNIFYVDVGQASVEEAQILTQKYEKFLKNKTTFIDTKTGDFKVDFNPATMLQDIIWPIRPGSGSKVEPLQNTMNIGPLVDLEHFATKMRIGLGVPKEYFDGEQSPGWNSKEALQLQDARFARKVAKLQNAFKAGVVGLCQIHYAITKQQYLPTEAFTVHLGSISDNTERLREEVLLRKAQVLEILTNVAVTAGWNRQVWSDYLLDEVFPLPVEFRKKLFTMDPVEKRRAELQIKAGQKPDGKHPLEGKPPRKVTADNLKMGFRSFGYGESNEVDALSPEILEEFATDIEFSNRTQELEEKEHMYANLNKKYASPSGYSEAEIKQLISSRDSIAMQLNEATTSSNTRWAKETDWKAIYKLGLNPTPEVVNSINEAKNKE